MCGIVGIIGSTPASYRLYDALTMLQHRGQDAAGIATCNAGRLYLHKARGLVREVFQNDDVAALLGQMGIGQVRYPTAGTDSIGEAQPLYVNSPYGIAISHNGNLTNTEDLSDELFKTDFRHVNTESDSEVLLNVFAHEIHKFRKIKLTPEEVFSAVNVLHQRCRGAYSVVAMIMEFGLVAFRDPHGTRPLIIGSREDEAGTEYMVASESVALDILGFKPLRDLKPSEVICITGPAGNRQLHTHQCIEGAELRPCIFEYVYLARPDSILDQISVYKSRLRAGERLARRVQDSFPGGHDIDAVIPIPDTSRTAALPLAYELGVKYREGFIKNRYIGRTFIMPDQQQRKDSVRRKLNLVELEFRDKNVLLVDDSIVRGNTSREIIRMAREAGAKKVYFASASPPVKYPNVYGIDMPSYEELVASDKCEQEVAESIGADKLIYQTLDDLICACREGNPSIKKFECSVFDGRYLPNDLANKGKRISG